MAYYNSGYSSLGSYGDFSSSRMRGSLLQSVIRKLEDSYDDEERQQHYDAIKADLSVAEENMDSLVKEHQTELHSTLATFGKIDGAIKESQMKVRMLRDNLNVCKSQLKCKRDELKRLWLEDVKYKKMLKLIDNIEKVKDVPELLKKYRASKKCYEATELLQNTVAMLDGELSNIEALKELRAELKQLRDGFHFELIEDLQRTVYTWSTISSQSGARLHQLPHLPHHMRGLPVTPSSPASNRKGITRLGHSSKSGNPELHVQVVPPSAFEETDGPEKSAVAYLGTLVDSLSILDRIPEMLEAVQSRMEKELVLIVERASIRISQMADNDGVPATLKPSATCDSPKYLRILLEMCFVQFQDVVAAHRILLDHLKKAKQTYKGKYELYDESDVWNTIQQVLRKTLEVYLAVDEDKPQTTTSAYALFMVAGREYDFPFIRRKAHPKARKQQLFRFDNSRHAISVSTYIKEQRDRELISQVKSGPLSHLDPQYEDTQGPSLSQHLLCRPSSRTITVMYEPLRRFVLEHIEEALELPAQTHCDLYHFLQDFVEQRFLDSVQAEYTQKLESSFKAEAKHTINLDAKSLRGTGKQALLSSALVLWECIEELQRLMFDMPIYSAHFLSIMVELLQGYHDACSASYRDLSTSGLLHPNDKHTHHSPVVSAYWSQDEGINTLLRTLPSWATLTTKRHSSSSGPRTTQLHALRDSIHAKETSTLLVSMGNEVTLKAHVLHDQENLRLLAVLHESLDWFAHKVHVMVDQLKQWQILLDKELQEEEEAADGGVLSRRRSVQEEQEIFDNEQQTHDLINIQLGKLEKDLRALSETIIIMLHLEVRCHCFYYLLPTLKQCDYVCEQEVADADSGVKDLAVDLRDIKTIMAGVLTQEKQRYLFDGLGHLVASIFIKSTQYLKRININGVKKMCRNILHMQSCLSKITSMRERDLDTAQQYFAMLYVNEEEFLKLVMEQGRVFTQVDYASALTLLANSQPQRNEIRLQKNLEKLDQMFAEDAC